MKILVQILKYFVGGLFIFSGLIKLNDPTGTAIKLEEYFEVFSSDFSPFFMSFVPYSMFLSVLLSSLEIILGIALIIQYRYKLILGILLAIIIFFSFLTFYSAFFNKVTDCGCFGDAIKLTPWGSFSKDLILLVCILFLLFQKEIPTPLFKKPISLAIVGLSIFGCLFLAWFALNHLPPIDFLAYKKGADILKLMKPSGPLKFKYLMEKDGKTVEFLDYPTDTTYTFKEMVLLNPEAKPKITDFNVRNNDGDYTQETFKGKKLLVTIVNANKADLEGINRVKKLAKDLEGSDVEVWVLTGSDELTFENFRHEVQLALPYYFVDVTVLKAMIRSNPGLIYMENGIIKGKWHYNDVPDTKDLKEL